MKKVVAFLLALIIFVAPVTTLVKADVVIGDNDETIINENATILGRKLALMESLSDLALSGVTDFTISNTNDVDSYLDYLWQEVNSAIDSLSDGTGFTEISNNLKSKFFTNLIQYKDYITNRGNYLAQLLPSGSPATTLLSTFFADNIYGKQYTQHYDLALDMFRSLSELTSDSDNGTPDPDYVSYINTINADNNTGLDFFWKNYTLNFPGYSSAEIYNTVNYYTYYSDNNNVSNGYFTTNAIKSCELADINIFSNNGAYSFTANLYNIPFANIHQTASPYVTAFKINLTNCEYQSRTNNSLYRQALNNSRTGTLQDIFSYLSTHYRNINIYVDGVPWSIVGIVNNPTLDIDGLIKIYGNDNPQQYELQPNTKIDYDQLYQVIYNAIRNNLPISQGDINYYDSHDNIYSPTIINNYGEEDGQESDLIDTILDYAVIPKFDTAIAQPMRQALNNGVVIMNNSVTNVIPKDILLVLGACFFLLLFAVVINRMIK